MWEFYLAASETAFRFQTLMVFQLQLVRRIDALPIRRDYMHHREALLMAGDLRSPAQDHGCPFAAKADSPRASAGR
jgi:cyclopropane-fatty-acyl-phospholipid synthase